MQPVQRVRTPARPSVAPAQADATKQERFLRQLVPPTWDEASSEDVAWGGEPEATPPAVDEDGGEGSPARDDQHSGDGEEASDNPPPAPVELAPTPFHALAPWAAIRDGECAIAAATGASPASGDPAWLGDIVERITGLAEGGDARFRHWTVTVPLDPEVLPDCELQLTLSPGTMALRFRTGSDESAALVCRHRDSLRARLEALPSTPAAIDIDLE